MRTSKVPRLREWSSDEVGRFLIAYTVSMMPFTIFAFYKMVTTGH
jgi:hypothetical protein